MAVTHQERLGCSNSQPAPQRLKVAALVLSAPVATNLLGDSSWRTALSSTSMASRYGPVRKQILDELGEVLTDEQIKIYREAQQERRQELRGRLRKRRG